MSKALALFLTFVAFPALAASPSQIQAGHALAQQYCIKCHVIAPGASKGWTNAPAFTAVANDPATTLSKLSQFIGQPHIHMLNTARPAPEAADLAAYIMSLRGQ
jgi:mono/diheme cytochrome c family protein